MKNLREAVRDLDGRGPQRALGLRLKLARVRRGLSLVEAARLQRVAPQTLERYELQTPVWVASDLAPWALLYQVRLDWLWSGEGPMTPEGPPTVRLDPPHLLKGSHTAE